MAGAVWFGTKGNMQWIPAPKVDVDASPQGYSNKIGFIGGGAWVRRSKTAARAYSFSWNLLSRANLQPVIDYAEGNYGDGFLYYSSPFTWNYNVLPAWLAAPFKNYYDGPLVVDGTRPTLTNNSVTTNGYPVEFAVYPVTSTSKVGSVFIPIPPGYDLYLGAAGTVLSGNAAVTVTPVISPIATGTPSNLTLLAPTSTTLTNKIVSSASYIGVNITLTSTSSGSIQLAGMTGLILPTGSAAPTGSFRTGLGQAGMAFDGWPTISEYSAALDQIGMTAKLVETEPWTWQ